MEKIYKKSWSLKVLSTLSKKLNVTFAKNLPYATFHGVYEKVTCIINIINPSIDSKNQKCVMVVVGDSVL